MLSSFLSSFFFCITVESSNLYNSFSFCFVVVVCYFFLSFVTFFFYICCNFSLESCVCVFVLELEGTTLFIFKIVSTFYNSIIFLYLPSKKRIRSNI